VTDTPSDPLRAAVERELYWADDMVPKGDMSAKEIRIALAEFTATMRHDQLAALPHDEPFLGDRTRWKRGMKAAMFSSLRPFGHRYDRLLGDLAELSRLLANRLIEAEGEIEQLRARLGDDESGP